MKKVIYSIHVDIPEQLLDETGYSVHSGKNKHRVNRAGETKDKLNAYNNRLIWTMKAYADHIDADYIIYTYNKEWIDYYLYCKKVYHNLPMYHIVNYYKHHLMRKLADQYDAVFYADLDVIPWTKESVFDAHDLNKIYAKNNNELAEWGKHADLTKYNSCDRNPVIKYWNCYALLLSQGFDPENNAINTGTMLGGSEAIKKLDWDGQFEYAVDCMKALQDDTATMFPKALHDRFAFDNETIFSYLVETQPIDYASFTDAWHGRLDDDAINPEYKMIHAINKRFDLIWPDIKYEGRNL